MRLSELGPRLSADGSILTFVCPCGEHSVRTWRGRPGSNGSLAVEGRDGWLFSGTLSDLTVEPSVDLRQGSPCRRHFSITRGEIVGA